MPFLLVSKLRLIEVFNTPNTKSTSTIFWVNILVMDMLSVSLNPLFLLIQKIPSVMVYKK